MIELFVEIHAGGIDNDLNNVDSSNTSVDQILERMRVSKFNSNVHVSLQNKIYLPIYIKYLHIFTGFFQGYILWIYTSNLIRSSSIL